MKLYRISKFCRLSDPWAVMRPIQGIWLPVDFFATWREAIDSLPNRSTNYPRIWPL